MPRSCVGPDHGVWKGWRPSAAVSIMGRLTNGGHDPVVGFSRLFNIPTSHHVSMEVGAVGVQRGCMCLGTSWSFVDSQR